MGKVNRDQIGEEIVLNDLTLVFLSLFGTLTKIIEKTT